MKRIFLIAGSTLALAIATPALAGNTSLVNGTGTGATAIIDQSLTATGSSDSSVTQNGVGEIVTVIQSSDATAGAMTDVVNMSQILQNGNSSFTAVIQDNIGLPDGAGTGNMAMIDQQADFSSIVSTSIGNLNTVDVTQTGMAFSFVGRQTFSCDLDLDHAPPSD